MLQFGEKYQVCRKNLAYKNFLSHPTSDSKMAGSVLISWGLSAPKCAFEVAAVELATEKLVDTVADLTRVGRRLIGTGNDEGCCV
jgi:hypothetical protein